MLPPLVGSVEFEDVSCSYYPGRPVLQHVTFRAEPGQTIALVGATGSGKTSIANLIPRFYDVDGGRVLIDGHDVRDVKLQSLRQQIGIVMQETLLFADTIRANIAYGRPGATDDEIRAAARAARADEFIERLPQGYDTGVEERGVSLSGGQKQRVAIARALLMNPRILILDEFTSSVDVATERLIRQALDRADAQPHHLRHRPPPVHRPRRRPDPGARSAASWSHTAPTTSCSRRSADYRDTYALQLQSDDDVSPDRPVSPLRAGAASEHDAPALPLSIGAVGGGLGAAASGGGGPAVRAMIARRPACGARAATPAAASTTSPTSTASSGTRASPDARPGLRPPAPRPAALGADPDHLRHR